MPQLIMRFGLTHETGDYDALVSALRRETGATITYLNEEVIREIVPGGRIEKTITILVRGEKDAVDLLRTWLDRLVGLRNVDLIAEDVAAETLFANALEARRDGRNEDALDWLDRVLAIDESLTAAWSNRANVLADLGRCADAEANYRRAIANNAVDALVHFNFGTFLLQLGRLEDAHAELKEASRLKPEFEEAKRGTELVEGLLRSRNSPL